MKLHLAFPGQYGIGSMAYLTDDKGRWIRRVKWGLWHEVKDFAELLRPALPTHGATDNLLQSSQAQGE